MRRVVSVTQLLTEIRSVLLKEPTLASVLLRGEISNYVRSRADHLYFSLKDRRCQVRCVMFASDARRLRFAPADGTTVLVSGQVTLYGARGDLQLQVRAMRPDGAGAVYEALERLKRRLTAEGVFDPKRKRPLPGFPRVVGVVTSLQGAVLHDIVTTLRRRNPAVAVVVAPAPVQGDEAPRRLARALRRLCARPGVECIIIARGGGSFEDLMAFNSEQVVRAVADCPLPVLSAVGHETDVTLCDLAADSRAPTPTAAAEMVAPPWSELLQELSGLRHRLYTAVAHRLGRHRQELSRLVSSPSLRYPMRFVEQEMQRLDELTARLPRALSARVVRERHQLEGLRRSPALRFPLRLVEAEADALHSLRDRLVPALERLACEHRAEVERLASHLGPALERRASEQRAVLERLEGKLESLSPLKVLDRGYALVLDDAGKPVQSVSGRSPGDSLEVRLADGSLRTRVESVASREEA